MLRDRVILVVGGSTGIGRATAIVCGQSIGVDGGTSATLGFDPQAALAD